MCMRCCYAAPKLAEKVHLDHQTLDVYPNTASLADIFAHPPSRERERGSFDDPVSLYRITIEDLLTPKVRSIMLDPMTALGLAGNAVQFVDFSIKLLGDAHEIHKSAQGSLQGNLDVEKVAEIIRTLQMKLRTQDDNNINTDGKAENSLERLCLSCDETAEELLEALEKLKVQGTRSPWKSMRQAIKSFKGKTAVVELCGRLKRFQDALELTILVDLRQKLNLQSVANSKNFQTLETTTQNIVLALLQNRSVFTMAIDAQTAELKEIFQKGAVAATLRHEDVKSTLFATVEDLSKLQSYEHGITRQEIAQRAACDAANLRAHMDKRTDEIRGLIEATGKAKGVKKRMQLAERANAAIASLAAMDLIRDSLMEILAKTNPNHARHCWKLESYEAKENINGPQEQVPRMPRLATEPPIIGPQETAAISDTASRSSTDSFASYSSLSPSESRSTVPNARGNLFEFEAKTSEPQQIHSPSLFSPFPRHQMSPNIPFSPQPTPGPGGGAGYFGAPHHPMSGHSTPGGYPGHDMMQYPPNPGYGGYGPHGAMGGHNMQHYPLWPPSEGSVVAVPDPEIEKKLLEWEEKFKAQKLEYEKIQKEVADKAEREAKEMAEKIEKGQKELAEKAARAQKELDELKKEEERKVLEKRAHDELRSRHIMIPRPSLWKRG